MKISWLEYIFLSRLNIKFPNLETIISENSVAQILTKKTQNVNSLLTTSDSKSSTDGQKPVEVVENEKGTMYGDRDRGKDK